MDYERIKEQIIWDRIKQMYNDMDDDAKSQVERVFPELKESEDERIRKALIRFHKSTIDIDGIKGDDIVAWLEKQGEQKLNSVLDIEIPFGAKDSELQETTYYIPKGFHAEIEGNNVIIKKGEQNTAWSEEDEKKRKGLIKGLEERMGFGLASDPFSREEYIDWLKSLRPQTTWKPSDEQMDNLSRAINGGTFQTSLLMELYQDLKKLRNG